MIGPPPREGGAEEVAAATGGAAALSPRALTPAVAAVPPAAAHAAPGAAAPAQAGAQGGPAAPAPDPGAGAAQASPQPGDTHRRLQAARVAVVILAVLAVGAVLSLGREVVFPIVAAALLSMLLSPIVAQLERLHLPRMVAALLVIVAVIGLIFLGIDALLGPLARALDSLPAMEGVARRLFRVLRFTMGDAFAKWGEAQLAHFKASAGDSAASGALFTHVVGASLALVTILLLAFFLLASGDLFLQKLIRVIPRIRDKVNALKIVRTVQEEVSRYLLTVTMINSGLGIVVGSVCWYFGLPNPILWGTIVGLLNFIPYLGPLISLTLLTMASAANFGTLGEVLMIPISFSAITLVEGQLLTPMIVGHRVELSPVVVFIGLLFWFWLWGIPGMIVAIPLLIIAKAWAQHTDALAAWAEFLGP